MCVAAIAGVQASSQQAAASTPTPVMSRIEKHPTRIILSLNWLLIIDGSVGRIQVKTPGFRVTPGRIITPIHLGCSASWSSRGNPAAAMWMCFGLHFEADKPIAYADEARTHGHIVT